MRTSRGKLCFIAVMAVLQAWGSLATTADAQQQRSSRRVVKVRSSEKAARRSWSPVRQARSPQIEPTAADSRKRVDRRQPTEGPAVRQTSGHQVSTPLPPGGVSVIESPVIDETAIPMDGQVMLAPIHDGVVACDGLPGGVCGCADGSCDGIGCDAIGACHSCGPAGCGELIGGNAWRPCATFCLPQDGWFSAEYLAWWQSGMDLPPLVTSSLGNNIDRADAGVLGRGATVTLFGSDEILDDNFDGTRLRFGIWLDSCHTWGLGADLFQIGDESVSFSRSSTGAPILARPFFNTATGVEDSELVAFPGVVSGTVGVDARSELQGWGVHVKRLRCADQGCSKWLFCGCPEHFCRRTEHLFGYRGLDLDENVHIRENLVGAGGEQFVINDRFDTRNQFNGLDLGWMQRFVRGYWTLDTGVRLAIGNTKQTVTISGDSVITDPSGNPNTPQSFNGGLLAQRSNIGTHERDEFSVVPELNATLGYQLTDNFRATVGYTFIYWSNVVRPGEHISRDLNPALLPPESDPFTGALRPTFAFDSTDYWAQGISVGGEYRW